MIVIGVGDPRLQLCVCSPSDFVRWRLKWFELSFGITNEGLYLVNKILPFDQGLKNFD